jgi:Protein of unknown function (DUF2752)
MELRVSSNFSSALLASAALAAGAIVLFAFDPSAYAFYPRCMFHALTGLDCPGCGATRAAHALLHGRVAEAFRFNPMLFAAIGVFGFALPSVARGRRPQFLERPWFAWTVVTVLIVWWIARNV